MIINSILLFFLSPFSSAYTVLDSDMNDWSWHQSTILGGFIKPTKKHKFTDYRFTPKEPSQLVVLNAAGGVTRSAEHATVRLLRAKSESKALVLVIPGTFGDRKSKAANALSEISYNNGMDSIIIPNPFSEEFQFSYSVYGLVGLPQTDLLNLQTLISDVLRYYSKTFGEPKKVIVVGLSLGGLFSTLLSKSAIASKIDRFIALNPPLNLEYSLTTIDHLIQMENERNIGFLRMVDGLVDSLFDSKRGVNRQNLSVLKEQIPGDENTNSVLIGKTFSRSLKKIFSNLRHMSIMPQDTELLEGIHALDKSRKKSFITYAGLLYEVQKIVGLIGQRSLDGLYKDIDYDTILSKNPRAKDIYVITNENDFIINKSHINSISDKLGSRLYVFKSGGHCGNYWAPSFQSIFADLLKK